MTPLTSSLKLIAARSKDRSTVARYVLACGVTPLHLKTFLTARLLDRIPTGSVQVDVGLFGDLLGTLRKLVTDRTEANGVAVVMEWSDLDARLGWRATHGWRPERRTDIAASVTQRLSELKDAITTLAASRPVAVSLPTLPLPPLGLGATGLGDAFAWSLRTHVFHFAAELATDSKVRVLDQQWLDATSTPALRHDLASDLRTGFPYRGEHAEALATGLANVLKPAAAKKAIITDLDNTFWRGIVGEDGVSNVAWDLDHHALGHGLYQELLASLAEIGVLVGVASKNDATVVDEALNRSDLVVPRDKLFPVEAHWGPKSESIRRMLAAWNILPDSVVFVDDSPIELAEVAASFPGMVCKQFPTQDDEAIGRLLNELRDLCGKPVVTAEDRLRVASLKAGAALAESSSNPDDFLSQAEAVVTLEWNQSDARSFELVNKTNQFNLNGRRWDEANWHARQADPAGFLLAVNYTDKFAPLGKISVLSGKKLGSKVARVDAWVLSCRAFSRRIEHATLAALFDELACDELLFDFTATDRNGPTQDMLRELLEQTDLSNGILTLTRSQFEKNCPTLFAQVRTHEQSRAKAA